ncbi:MAG: phosphate ABC transporter substrate-binding protein [Candidatus Aminicenantales bacterium]
MIVKIDTTKLVGYIFSLKAMKKKRVADYSLLLLVICTQVILICFVLAGFFACSRGAKQGSLTVAGSTSIQPFADQWAEVFMHKNPGKIINVQGGGSSAGIQAALSGAAQIGMSSRDLKREEKVLTEFVVAWDGLAIIVHPTNPIENLTLEATRQIFAGAITSWRQLGWLDKAIHVVTREEGSGTRGAFQEMVMGRTKIGKKAIVEDSNGTVREVVANDPYAIGYISLGLINERVKAVSLDGVEPRMENVISRKYQLVRPFLLLTSGAPQGVAAAFIQFVLSEEGQTLIGKQGLIPGRLVGQEKRMTPEEESWKN